MAAPWVRSGAPRVLQDGFVIGNLHAPYAAAFRPKNPQQPFDKLRTGLAKGAPRTEAEDAAASTQKTQAVRRSIFRIEHLLRPERVRQLEGTWAGDFRDYVLPLIKEKEFADMYCPNNGAPNKSVRTLAALALLKNEYEWSFLIP